MPYVLIIAVYLLGSVSGSLCLGKLRGVDIRTLGSGNAGGTNALRTQGVTFALGVVLVDVGKGLLAAAMAQYFFAGNAVLAYACVFTAVIGHIWPIWHGFRGGKGAATLLGGLVLLWPQALLLMLGVWVLSVLLTGYVGLSTVLAATSLLASAAYADADGSRWLFALTMAVLLTYSHRSNLQRLRQGTENRFEKARVLGRLVFGRRG